MLNRNKTLARELDNPAIVLVVVQTFDLVALKLCFPWNIFFRHKNSIKVISC